MGLMLYISKVPIFGEKLIHTIKNPMKYILLLFLLSGTIACSQNKIDLPVDSRTNLVTYRDTISLAPGMDKEKIFHLLESWMQLKKADTSDTRENNIQDGDYNGLSGKGSFPVYMMESGKRVNHGLVKFNIYFQCRQGKFEYNFNEFTQEQMGTYSYMQIEKWKANGIKSAMEDSFRVQVRESMEKTIQSLKSYM